MKPEEPQFEPDVFFKLSYEDKKLYLSVLSEKTKKENKRFFENIHGLVWWNNGKD